MEKSQDSKVKKFYLLDGKIVDDAETIEQIKSFIPQKTYTCHKQLASGVAEDRQVKFQRIKADNVLCLHQNADHTITNLNREIVITPNDLKKMLEK
jgi:wobble nucleotide-excising tRNase